MLLFAAEPAPPRSLFAVNATHSSVTLLWTEEGVVDYYQVLCKPTRPSKELQVKLYSPHSIRPSGRFTQNQPVENLKRDRKH